MKEDFLHYLWKHRLFRFLGVETTHGELLKIIFPGYHNEDAGPDFKQAVIQIGNMKWAGDVEIHLRSSDWYRHQHHLDEKYRSVILHVVYEHDGEVERQKGECFPTLEMKSYVPAGMYERYCELMQTPETICCANYLPKMDALHLNATLSTMVMERLLRKQQRILEMVAQCQNDWNEALYRQLAIAFGFKTNAVAFELLAHSLPYKIIQKHADALSQVNALIFGQAGLLNEEPLDEYQSQLKYEYDYLRYKYQLAPIELYHWNLLRLRPSNFPCVRLSQFAAIMHKIPNMMSLLLGNVSVALLRSFFFVEADDYWHYHYHFGRTNMMKHTVALGDTAITSLLINTVVPFLFAYNRFRGEEDLLEANVAMLEKLPFEDNKLTRYYRDLLFPKDTAWDSQALLELYQNYCQPKRCLTCAIGERILQEINDKKGNGCPDEQP